METSLAEDVKKPTRTLSPDSFFFMSPYRSFTTSGCFRRFSQPAVGGDALNGEFQQQMAAAFAEARAAGIRKPVMVGGYPVRHPVSLPSSISPSAGKRSLARKSSVPPASCRAAGGDGGGGASGDPGAGRVFSHGGTRRRADRHPGSRQSGAIKAYRYYHPRPRRQRALMERLIAQNPASFNFHVPLSDGGVLRWAPARSCCCVKKDSTSALCRWPAPPVASRTMCWIGKQATGCWPPARSPRARAGDPGDEERAGPAQQSAVATGVAAADYHPDAPASGDADRRHRAGGRKRHVAGLLCCTRRRRWSGSPHQAAKRLIAELEPFDRQLFGGIVGWCDDEGNGEWVVTIRCARLPQQRTLRLFAGAGIVPASSPLGEWRETGVKLTTMLNVFGLN